MHANKILDRRELRDRVAEWKASGECITLANGCFDLLHVGHVRYLHAAKQLGGNQVAAADVQAPVVHRAIDKSMR